MKGQQITYHVMLYIDLTNSPNSCLLLSFFTFPLVCCDRANVASLMVVWRACQPASAAPLEAAYAVDKSFVDLFFLSVLLLMF